MNLERTFINEYSKIPRSDMNVSPQWQEEAAAHARQLIDQNCMEWVMFKKGVEAATAKVYLIAWKREDGGPHVTLSSLSINVEDPDPDAWDKNQIQLVEAHRNYANGSASVDVVLNILRNILSLAGVQVVIEE